VNELKTLVIRAVIENTEETKLQLDVVGLDVALIDVWQVQD